jgi:hypothetical protein
MSHFTSIRVQIENGEILLEALKDLGYKVEQNAMVRGYQGNKAKADYVIRQSNGYDLGFRKVGASYELVADFWGARIDQQAFIGAVTQKYAHKALLVNAQAQGFAIEQSEILPDGTVRVVVGRWV